MQQYISIRVHTALYISVFLLAFHHVFAYFANASILEFFFNLHTAQVITVYGSASIFGLLIFIWLSKKDTVSTKTQIYIASVVEMVCLCVMYYTSTSIELLSKEVALLAYLLAFCIHHLLTPYILYNLDTLFEAYTHVQDRGKGRGIYLTMWVTPFVLAPLLLSGLDMTSLPIVYLASIALILPFTLFVFFYLQEPSRKDADIAPYENTKSFIHKLKNFWSDKLDRQSFITQTVLHLYYGVTGVLLPIYLYTYFGFDWSKIGLLIAITMMPFMLIQIPFGNIEDKRHNEKFLFYLGILIAVVCTVAALFVSPTTVPETGFLLLTTFLFLSRVGCSLIEISTESMFYKHVTEKDEFALLMFRAGRILPYAFGIGALFFI